jgi:hypothetical protein
MESEHCNDAQDINFFLTGARRARYYAHPARSAAHESMGTGAVKPLLRIGIAVAHLLLLAVSLQAGRLHKSNDNKSLPVSAPVRWHRQPSPVVASSPSTLRAVLDRYCIACHNERLRTANLALDMISLDDVGGNAATWERVVQKLRSHAMPPAGRPRPDDTTYRAFAEWLETALDRAAAIAPNPGRPAIHRLNRTEYTNAIHQILALDIDGRALLPVDDTAYGFDNNADVLTISPALLERYLLMARRISRLVVGDRRMRPVAETYSVSELLEQDDRLSEDLPFGSRGGTAFHHYFPLDGEYTLRIRLQRDKAGTGTIRGLAGGPQQIDVHVGGVRIQRFTVGGQGPQLRSSGAEPADAHLEVRFPARAGSSLVGVSIVKVATAPEGVGPTRLPVWTFTVANERIGIDTVQIEGPFNAQGPGDSPARRKVFVCSPTVPQDEERCARQILSTLARRAFRRPVTMPDIQQLMDVYTTSRGESGFEAGIQAALEQILVDPEFLFRLERDPVGVPPATAYRLSDLELASRLSFFLWSSIPDDELLEAAAAGRLRDPAVLEHQVRRMLDDRRSIAFIENFGEQWLHIRSLRGVKPDVNAFPEFDDNLREAFQRETVLFLESQVRQDHSVIDLLTADYTYANERLARHYGIPNVYGTRFRRVALSGERGGLLGHGSILTVTSHATRTSPVLRGKWVLENLLGSPPPPPPANVPPLKENGAGDPPQSVRERLEEHRKNPVCASCHARMDPIGFALEHFDAIGRWRDTEGGVSIDASATLPDGTAFQGAAQLRKLLVSRRSEFVRALTEILLTYALGRGLEHYDLPAVRDILRQAEAHNYRWSDLVVNIVRSTPFQMRRSEP